MITTQLQCSICHKETTELYGDRDYPECRECLGLPVIPGHDHYCPDCQALYRCECPLAEVATIYCNFHDWEIAEARDGGERKFRQTIFMVEEA